MKTFKLPALSLFLFWAMTGIAQNVKTPIGGIRIAWDFNTLVKVSSNQARYSGYARLIQLADSSLIGVYEAEGSVYCVKSTDVGKTWSDQVLIAPRAGGVNMAVPDILQLKDHSLLACYNPRPGRRPVDTTKHFGIKTKKSYDGGKTWTEERTLYQADYLFDNGCWEPSAIQLPNGDIELFFANENPYRQSNEQCISMVKSKDGGLSWSAARTTSFRPHSRDGMPSPILLQNGKEMAYSIEDNGFKNFKPTIIRSTLKDDWAKPVGANDANRNFALANKVPDSLYLGAPYLRQLKTGETILSYQGTEGRINNMNHSDMKVVIGDNEARNFDRKTVPFLVAKNRSALWNSLSVLNDNTVVALASMNYQAPIDPFSADTARSVDNSVRVWMIKGHVIPQLAAKKQSVKINDQADEPVWKLHMPVFIGHDSPATLEANFSYDDQNLYVLVRVSDNPTDTNAVAISIDPQNESYDAPGAGVYKINVAMNNTITAFEGNSGAWKPANLKGVKATAPKYLVGYLQKIVIPWAAIGGKPALHRRIGLDMALTNMEGHTENISANEADKPFTWCTLQLY
jgi:hypothetical protein